MTTINLHQIFRYLTKDDELLSVVVNNKPKNAVPKKNKKVQINMMSSMIIEYVPLAPYETQTYASFPQTIKNFLTPNHVRYGIKNIIEKNMINTNISFLSSLNILLRPDIYQLSTDDQIKNLSLLEEFIKHRISRNYQIDKVVKNTRKIQIINKESIKNMTEGKITHDLIQFVVNIFEINLLVFDFITYDVSLYWTYGSKNPNLNVFKNICCMSYVQGNYEPIFTKNNSIAAKDLHLLYTKILTDSTIKCIKEIELAPHTFIAIDTWDIPHESFFNIVETYFHPEIIDD